MRHRPSTSHYTNSVPSRRKKPRSKYKTCSSMGLSGLPNSHMVPPVLFVPKKYGNLRFGIDYCCLNKFTIWNQYPLLVTSYYKKRCLNLIWSQVIGKCQYESRTFRRQNFELGGACMSFWECLLVLSMPYHSSCKWWMMSSPITSMVSF